MKNDTKAAQPPRLMTAYEASRRLGVTMRRVYQMIDAGELRTMRGVRDVRYVIWRPDTAARLT